MYEVSTSVSSATASSASVSILVTSSSCLVEASFLSHEVDLVGKTKLLHRLTGINLLFLCHYNLERSLSTQKNTYPPFHTLTLPNPKRHIFFFFTRNLSCETTNCGEKSKQTNKLKIKKDGSV